MNISYSFFHELLHERKASVILRSVFSRMGAKRIFVFGEVSLGPGQGWDVHTLDGSGVRAAEEPNRSAVEASLE